MNVIWRVTSNSSDLIHSQHDIIYHVEIEIVFTSLKATA